MTLSTQHVVVSARTGKPIRVCIHALDTARTNYRVMRAATALSSVGYEVTVVDVEPTSIGVAEEEYKGIHFKHIVMASWFLPTRFKPWFLVKAALMFVLGTWRVLLTPADIYHAYIEKALPACYIASLLHHKPLIFEAPELPLDDPSVTRWRRLYAIAMHILTYLISHCAGVITVSPPLVQELQRWHGLSEVTLVRNILPYQEVSRTNRLRERLALSSQTRIALYQGNLQADRRLDLLVQAAAFLPTDIVVVLLGKPYGPTVGQLRVLIEEQELQERVYMVPAVPYEELLEWTASADVGVILCSPDYSRNIEMLLPNKLFEYLMAGLPVLASALPAIVEIVNRYQVGCVVNSLAPREIAQAIVEMLADRQALTLMREHALIAARDELHWQKEQEALLQLYQNLLGS